MIISNNNTTILDFRQGIEEDLLISDCQIGTLDFGFTEFKFPVTVRNSIINTLELHTSWFSQGFILENCIVKNHVQYEMGGHNNRPVIIRGNVFCDKFMFFDCIFDDKVFIENNVFIKGSNVLGITMNDFGGGQVLNSNAGNLYLDFID